MRIEKNTKHKRICSEKQTVKQQSVELVLTSGQKLSAVSSSRCDTDNDCGRL